ncbi:UvrABC system protein A [compost metagenome]
MIKTADWIVDLGPEGGHRGGTVLVTGTPEDVAAHPDSYTGQFLAKMLPSTSARPEQPAAVANKPDARPPRKEKPAKKTAAKKAAAPAKKKASK